ncbi:hypothetical protein CK203_066863 [Vitis vinifera]|uniref:Uncharacterized protein n=1 Tax=Vitis vinifera TaxID=29760 RepID=A0A438EVA5_VITVI|nr:hypothetical protein CK203_066863 [Vitis vinifera]
MVDFLSLLLPSAYLLYLDIGQIQKRQSHRSVLGLAWNKEYRNILASASADKLVKIWDVTSGECNITMDHHTDKASIGLYFHCCILLHGLKKI